MGFAIFVLLMIGLVAFLSRKALFRKRVVRRLSDDQQLYESSRVPVTGPCACGKPRCPYKGKKHPPQTTPGRHAHTVHRVEQLRKKK